MPLRFYLGTEGTHGSDQLLKSGIDESTYLKMSLELMNCKKAKIFIISPDALMKYWTLHHWKLEDCFRLMKELVITASFHDRHFKSVLILTCDVVLYITIFTNYDFWMESSY